MDREQNSRGNRECDRIEVLDGIVGDRAVKGRIDDQGGCGDEKSIAVGRRFRRSAHADIAACASYILNKELLPEMFGKSLRDQTRKQTGRAAGLIVHGPEYRTRRRGLCPCGEGDKRQRGNARREMQKLATRKVHGVPPGCRETMMQELSSVGTFHGALLSQIERRPSLAGTLQGLRRPLNSILRTFEL